MHQQPHTMLFQPERLQPAGRQQSERTQPRTYRASNEDRQRTTEQLQAHYVAGRLNATELESRVEQALAAVTLGDLDLVLADLPTPSVESAAPVPEGRIRHKHWRHGAHHEQSFRAHATSYLLVIGMLVVIWALTSPGGYFWPVWPMLGWGVGLAAHGLAARNGQSSALSLR